MPNPLEAKPLEAKPLEAKPFAGNPPLGNPLAARLAMRPVIVLDGGLATELQRRGADLNDPLW